MSKNTRLLSILFIVLSAIAVRIPHVLDSNLVLDGDEAIIGLMAIDFIENGKFPGYFAGQHYGLSTIEVLTSAFSFQIFGIQDWAQKLSTFVIWVIGLIYFYKALTHIQPKHWKMALLISLLLAWAPTWLYWSMKARGGYVSAFCAVSVLLFLITKPQPKSSNYIFIGVLFSLISQFQLLFCLGVIPLILYKTVHQWKNKSWLIPISGIVTMLMLYPAKIAQVNIWNPSLLTFNHGISSWLSNFPLRLTHHFSGTYYLGANWPMTPLALACGALLTLFLGSFLLYTLIKWGKRKELFNTKSLLAFGIGGNIVVSFFLIPGGRYYLPILMLLLLLVFLSFKKETLKVNVALGALCLLFISASLRNPFKVKADQYRFATNMDKSSLNLLSETLEKEKIKNVFTANGLGQYQLMFYTKGEVNARYLLEKD
ncbi:MAG: hypothetical protein N4A46_10510, partial [Schleiferiaceae bacterium]|nr:hypothetical protein [Schleiferiaceae bacterium]